MLKNIEAERARIGLSKEALAKELGISSNTYRGYVNGSPIPSDVLVAMADLFKCKTDYLLGLVDMSTETHRPAARP